MDADSLLKNYSNDASSVERLVREVISTESSNDFLVFEVKKLEIINEIKEYTGIRIYLIGSIERTKTPFTIDFGVGDIIVPSKVILKLRNKHHILLIF